MLSPSAMVRLASLTLIALLWGRVVSAQEVQVAAWQARRLAAEAEARARQAYFDDAGSPPLTLGQAFPDLDGAPLNDAGFVRARQQQLTTALEGRARARIELGDDETDVAAAARAAYAAEDAADALEAQLLAGLSAGIQMAPGFGRASMDAAVSKWKDTIAAARDVTDDDPRWRELSREALAAAAAERLLTLHYRAALRRMTVPGDGELARLVEADLRALESPALEGLEREALLDRLRRARPLLDSELRLEVAAALTDPEARRDAAEAQGRETTGDARAPESERVPDVELERHARRRDTLNALRERFIDIEERAREARTLSFLDERRAAALQASYDDDNALVLDLRTAIQELDAERSSDAAAEASPERTEHLQSELYAYMALLRSALELRRDLAPAASMDLGSDAFGRELSLELEQAPLWLEIASRQQIDSILSLPERLLDPDELAELFRVSFALVLLGLVWLYLRRAFGSRLRRAIDRLKDRQLARYGVTARFVSTEELANIGRHLTDALGALVLHWLLLPRNELLALAALPLVAWALLKSVPPLVKLVLVLFGRVLDPLALDSAVSAEIQKLAERTTSWFLWWWIASAILSFVAVPLLQADRLYAVVGITSWLVFAVLAVVGLTRWSSYIREFIAGLADQNRVTEWLTQPTRSVLKRAALAATGVIFIVGRIAFWVLVGRGWVTREQTSLVVSRIRSPGPDTELLPLAERQKIAEAPPSHVDRGADLKKLRGVFEAWQQERRRGLVAVLGDRGMGKTVFLDQVGRSIDSSGTDIRLKWLRLEPGSSESSLRERFAWLTGPLGVTLPNCAAAATIEKALVEHLGSSRPSVLLVDDAHYLFRRRVGGFGALETMLNIIQACGDKHFWVVTLHRPAAIYMRGLSASIQHALREQIELQPLTAEELDTSLMTRTESAGFEPRFKELLQRPSVGSDWEQNEAKARKIYWRVVAHASSGNPLVALDYWLSSLGAPNGKGGRALPVYLAPSHYDAEVENLSDDYMFSLSALVVHDGLTEQELSRVLNVSEPKAGATCLHLESLGIVHRQGDRFLVSAGWQLPVLRVLDRKSFAYR